MIPNEFTIGGGHKVFVSIKDELYTTDKTTSIFGRFISSGSLIEIARKLKEENGEYVQSEEEQERTFYHELIHCFQFYSGREYSEEEAQVFSNFIYEYLHSKR